MIDGLKPYAAYKNSGVPWASEVPVHWTIKRGKALFRESHLPVRDTDEIVTCFRDGQVTLRRNRRTTGFMTALKEVGYQGVRGGQLVIHAMDAFAGAVGVSDSDGKCSPEYIVCEPRSPEYIPSYFARALRLAAHSNFIQVACLAVRERAPRLRYPNFANMLLPVPAPDDQAAIVRFLQQADRRIQRYITAKQKLIKLLADRREALTVDTLQLASTRSIRLGSAVDKIERPISRQYEQVYTPIGLYNRGRGIFHKEPTKGSDLGDSIFFWLAEGDLVLSGQFAWEGAVALAGTEDEGCIASHRYPVLRGKSDTIESAYLLSFFRTGWGQLLLDHHSRGAAGRNRPLNVESLMKEKVPVPPLPVQKQITTLVHLESRLQHAVAKQLVLLREYRARLIADVSGGAKIPHL